MDELVQPFEAATASDEIPGVVVAVETTGGHHSYIKTFGRNSLKSNSKPLEQDAVFWLASASKIIGVVAVLQCVEQGHFKLDDEIASYLPQWKDPDVLVGWTESGEPILHKAKKAITIRMLISHTSGQVEPMCSDELCKYMDYTNEDPDFMYRLLSLEVRPLLFEPGTSWAYSPGIDWAGKIIQKVHNCSLEEYLQKHIFQPLHMQSTTLHPWKRADIKDRLVDMSYRPADTGNLIWHEHFLPRNPPHEYAGGSVCTTASDFLAFLSSLLRNDGKILSTQSVEELFSPQVQHADRVLSDDNKHALGGLFPENVTKIDHALVGVLNLEDLGPLRRRKNTLTWAGGSMHMFWIDRESGLCAFYGSHITPEGLEEDPPSLKYMDMFEKAVYKQLEQWS